MAEPATGLRPLLGPETQLGYVVRDIEAAMRHWIDVFGVGPFLFMEKGTGRPPGRTVYKGEETVVETRLAFTYMGDVQIELIEQVNAAPSPYRDFLAAGREGLQHLGFWVPDYARACQTLEAAGYRGDYVIPVAIEDQPIIYYSSPALQGPMIEIVPPQWQKARQGLRTYIRSRLDGDPILRFGTYGDFLVEADVRFD